MASNIKLKPCPFCGSKARFTETQDTYETDGGVVLPTWHYEVCCTKCLIQTCSVLGGDPEKVIAAWNRRVEA